MSVGDTSSLRILLVEDNAGDALLLCNLLRAQRPSVEVLVATDGEKALEVLQAARTPGGFTPDIVLLDINLPRKNGFEVLVEMRAMSHLSGIPVFFLSGSRAHEDIAKGMALQVDAFLTKPSLLDEYEQLVERLFTVDFPRALKTRKQRGRADVV